MVQPFENWQEKSLYSDESSIRVSGIWMLNVFFVAFCNFVEQRICRKNEIFEKTKEALKRLSTVKLQKHLLHGFFDS